MNIFILFHCKILSLVIYFFHSLKNNYYSRFNIFYFFSSLNYTIKIENKRKQKKKFKIKIKISIKIICLFLFFFFLIFNHFNIKFTYLKIKVIFFSLIYSAIFFIFWYII
jgi:hypothetical protein